MTIEEVKQKNKYLEGVIRSQFKEHLQMWLKNTEFPEIPKMDSETMDLANSFKDAFEAFKTMTLEEIETL